MSIVCNAGWPTSKCFPVTSIPRLVSPGVPLTISRECSDCGMSACSSSTRLRVLRVVWQGILQQWSPSDHGITFPLCSQLNRNIWKPLRRSSGSALTTTSVADTKKICTTLADSCPGSKYRPWRSQMTTYRFRPYVPSHLGVSPALES
jgi:hypothetical protein